MSSFSIFSWPFLSIFRPWQAILLYSQYDLSQCLNAMIYSPCSSGHVSKSVKWRLYHLGREKKNCTGRYRFKALSGAPKHTKLSNLWLTKHKPSLQTDYFMDSCFKSSEKRYLEHDLQTILLGMVQFKKYLGTMRSPKTRCLVRS